MTQAPWLTEITEKQPKLNAMEKRLRDKFVEQYTLDYNPYKACMRMGYQRNSAEQMADMLMTCGYVLNCIEEIKRQPGLQLERIKNWVHSELIEAASTSTGSAKVAALGKIMDLHGLVNVPITQTNNNTGPVELAELSEEEFDNLCRQKGISITVPGYDKVTY